MYKLKPLETTQQVLMWLCICPVVETVNKNKKLACIGLSSTVLLIIATQVIGSILFVERYAAVNLELSLYAFYQIFGWGPIFHMFVVALVLRHRITKLFVQLSNIYETSYKLSEY